MADVEHWEPVDRSRLWADPNWGFHGARNLPVKG